MKKMTYDKIHDEKGVTILLALVGFMAAAMVSIVIITAALSASRSVIDDRKNTQAHLTLESAAKIVRNQMDEAYGSQTLVTKTTSKGSAAYTYGSSGTFGSEMQKAVKYIDDYNFTTNYESNDDELTISVSDADADMENVLVSFVMQPYNADDGVSPYHLIFTFHLNDSKEEVYLKMNGVDDTESHQIYWQTVSISEIGGTNEN